MIEIPVGDEQEAELYLTVQEKATIALDWFEMDTREDGSHYWRRCSGAPEPARDLAHAAHGDGLILPDDYRYQFMIDALDALSEAEDEDDAYMLLEADVYTRDLTEWLNSSPLRVYYLGEAMDVYADGDGFQVLACAQLEEKQEVLYMVKDWLEKWEPDEELD